MAERHLVVTADDFGTAWAVNEAVEIAHQRGILTAASLMVRGNAVDDAVERARRLPGLGVGLHIVLVDGRPVLPPEQVPALVRPDGCFHDSMARTAWRIALDPHAHRQMCAEVAAQFAAFAAFGLPLDHANAHKHFHLHPMIARAILAVGPAYGLRAIRLPYEAGSGAMAWWASLLGRRWRRSGICTNDQLFGLSMTGAVTPERMRAALAALPAGLTEIYTHPASTDDWAGAVTNYHYRDELAALTDPQARALLATQGVQTGPFAHFTGMKRAA